jgi:hypothetical protein
MRTVLLCTLLASVGCSASDPPPAPPIVGETRQIVPSSGLPLEYTRIAGLSNNNLDVTRHDGRVFLATRKAPDHFASTETRLFVFSSPEGDEERWDFEAEVHLGSDVREPRLLSLKGRLFLYFAQLGTNSATFEPKAMFVIERMGPAQWTAPAPFYKPGEPYIPWRVKVRDGAAWMTVYKNGQYIYDFSGLPMDVELLRSDDGVAWAPVDPARPVVTSGGGSETDFDFDDAGDLYAVVRNEAGDETGWGSKICRAKKSALSSWSCVHDPKKYDSPLVFAHAGQILLVGRRNVSETGHYELYPGKEWSAVTTAAIQADYWTRPKRCSLWHVDRTTLRVTFLVDIPGWGDTCFASLLDGGGGAAKERVIYNYSSPLDDPTNADRTWQAGQAGETRIYRTALTFR